MTVSVQETRFPQVANGVTVDFPFSCLIPTAEDLVLTVDDVQVNSGFSVSGLGNATGGMVTFSTPPADGAVVVIERVIKLKRSTDYQQTGDFLSKIVNPDFDRIWMALQQIETALGLQPNAVSRALLLGRSDTNGSGAYRAMQNRIQDLDDPVNTQDAANRRWVEGEIGRLITNGAGQYVLDLLAASSGGSLVGWLPAGTGAAARTVQDKLRERVSVKDFGAAGDGVADDTLAIQKAITAVRALVNGTLYFPATTGSYKVTGALTITGPISIEGDGANATQIISSGMSSGQYMLDFNCLAADAVEYVRISNLTIRSLNGSPSGVRLKNAAYVTLDNVRLYNLYNGIVIDGTRCFTHKYDNVAGYSIGNQTINFASTFTGGGQFTFNGSTFGGDVGIGVSSGAVTDSIDIFGCNFEQCITNGLFVAGTVNGLCVSGGRTEGCDGIDFVIRPFGAAEYVGGLSISGVVFSSSDNAGASRIQLGGSSGKVRGFNITGNTVIHSIDAYGAKMVTLNGDGESGIIAGNYIRGTTAGGAGVVNAQRAGVVVFGNENLTGKLPEYWGTADWGVDQGTFTPVDASGAGLTFTAATGKYTKIGRMVMWQAFVTYPATGNTANAEIGGLPYAVGTSISAGFAGARMDMTNLGTDVAVQHGANTSTRMILANRLTGASLTNATVSGKYFYLSGTYSM